MQQSSEPAHVKKTSSINTIFALVNSMIGGTMLTLPLLFRDSGLITSTIILVLSGMISRKTCDIYIQHLAEGEHDIQDSVRRIMKGRWYEFFCLITGVYLIMLNVLYIVLINDQLYNIIKFALAMAGKNDVLADKNQFTFSKFGEQWLAVITFLPLLATLFIKNLRLLVKMTAIGVVSVFVYFIFIGYAFVDNISQGNVDVSTMKLVSWDIGNLAGTAALAFTIHTVVAPIMRTNQNQEHNSRDLSISYLMGTLIYAFIGICGAYGIENRDLCAGNTAQTVIDCFPDQDWQPLIVSIMYLLGLVTVFPCFMDVSRQRLFAAFSPNPIKDLHRAIFNVIFMLISFGFEILAPYIKLSDIMNFNGAIFCFFFVYLIPIGLHLKCYYGTPIEQSSLITQETDQALNEYANGKCGHKLKDINAIPKWSRYMIYSILLIIGLTTMVYGVYSSILIFM